MKKQRRTDEAGMTLIELMFATGVVGTALAMMFGSLMTIATVGSISQERTNAMLQANSVLEEIRSLDQEELLQYQAPALDNGPGTVSTAVAIAYDENDAAVWLPRTSETSVALPNPTEIRVIVVWLDARGRIYNVESSTMVGF